MIIAAAVIATQIVGHRPPTALHLSSGSPSAAAIKSLTITPETVQLTQHHTVHLLLAGVGASGSAVPDAVLAGASWASADPSVAGRVHQYGRRKDLGDGVGIRTGYRALPELSDAVPG